MIGLDLLGADVRDTVKSAAPGVVDLVFDAAEGKDKKKEVAAAQAKKEADAKRTAEKDEPSFFSKAIVGPVKIWHALVGALAAGGGVWWWRRKK